MQPSSKFVGRSSRALKSRAKGLIMACSLAVAASGCSSGPSTAARHAASPGCDCGNGAECYDAASELASAEGETAATGERLVVFAQCACDRGSTAGCNTLSHFARDFVADCDRLTGADPNQLHAALAQITDNQRTALGDTCAVAGYVHEGGIRVPRINGRSFSRDPAAARRSFAFACDVGITSVCNR